MTNDSEPILLDKVISSFIDLGGTFDNVRIENGQFGLGLFIADPKKKFRVHVPEDLLLETKFANLNFLKKISINKQSGWSRSKRLFFSNYQKCCGWNARSFEKVFKHQTALQGLPQEVARQLDGFGVESNSKKRLTYKYLFHKHMSSRTIFYKGNSVIMPVIELFNHSDVGRPFIFNGGIEIQGKGSGEIFSRYHSAMDGFDFFNLYGFSNNPILGYSCTTNIKVHKENISIIRSSQSEPKSKLIWKHHKNRELDRGILFRDVLLKDAISPDKPMKIFVERCLKYGLAASTSKDIFQGLLRHNTLVTKDFLGTIRSMEFSLKPVISQVVERHLELLCTR